MKIRYLGQSAVHIDGHDDVQPGDVVDVSHELGELLLFAGSNVDDDGVVTPPVSPLWEAVSKVDAKVDAKAKPDSNQADPAALEEV